MAMLPWNTIDTALVDMDGVLLDRHFDDAFWHEHVPARYAERRGVPEDEARRELVARYRAQEGTLNWTDLTYWSRELGLDIPALKAGAADRVAWLPHATCFLDALAASGIHRVLVTNAHPETVRIKRAATGLDTRLDTIVSAFDLGVGKEDEAFWRRLAAAVPYHPAGTVLVEDSISNLRSARAYGIAHLVHVNRPNTRAAAAPHPEFTSVAGVRDLVPGLLPEPLRSRSPRTGTACECSEPAPTAPPH
jgi:HAD superfamily hydrolase (TIGR01509 family)